MTVCSIAEKIIFLIVFSVADLIIFFDICDEKYDTEEAWLWVESNFNKSLWGAISELGKK